VAKRGDNTSRKALSHYPLDRVKSLIKSGRYIISYNAFAYANKDFGWRARDIKSAMLQLQTEHFYKTETSRYDNKIMIDYYKAYGLLGEDVYIHFRIDEESNKLTIESFKRI
jgi:hypothetical protein